MTTVSTTRISAAATVQPISSRVLPWIWAATAVLLGAELVDRVDERPLDDHEHDRGDVEDDLVQRVDLVGVRRAAGLRGDEVRASATAARSAARRPRRGRRASEEPCGGGAGVERRGARRRHSIHGQRRPPSGHREGPEPAYTRASCACRGPSERRAWALVAAGVAAPAVRRRAEAAAPPRCSAPRGARRWRCASRCRAARARDVAVVRAEHVGLRRGLRDAARRPRAARGPGAGRLPARGRPDARARGCPRRSACSGRSRRRARSTASSACSCWCHWVWFVVPHGSVAYVLIRRPRRFAGAAARMYAVFDLGAVFYWAIPTAPPWWAAAARAGSRTGETGPGAPDDDRVRPAVLGRPLGAPLRCPRRKSPCCDAVAAFRHVADGRAPALARSDPVAGAVGWAYAVALGLALVYLGEHYAGRPDRRRGADRGRSGPPRRAPRRSARRLVAGLEATADAGARGGMAEDHATEEQVRLPAPPDAPGAAITTRRDAAGPASRGAAARVAAVRRRRASRSCTSCCRSCSACRRPGTGSSAGTCGGSALAAVLEVLSFAGYVWLFRAVFVRGESRIGWRESYQITMAALAATRLFAAGRRRRDRADRLGAAPLRARAAESWRRRMIAFLVLLYGVYMVTLVVDGLGLYLGRLPRPGAVRDHGRARDLRRGRDRAVPGDGVRSPATSSGSSPGGRRPSTGVGRLAAAPGRAPGDGRDRRARPRSSWSARTTPRCSARSRGGGSTSRCCGRASTRSAARRRRP